MASLLSQITRSLEFEEKRSWCLTLAWTWTGPERTAVAKSAFPEVGRKRGGGLFYKSHRQYGEVVGFQGCMMTNQSITFLGEETLTFFTAGR